MLMLPEIIVIVSAFAILILDLFLKDSQRKILGPLALVGVGGALATLLITIPQSGEIFGGRFLVDPVAWWFKVLFLISAFITVILSMDILDGSAKVPVKSMGSPGEYYTVLLFTLSGMMFLISSTEMITLYVSLELTTLPLFILTAWKHDDVLSGEGGLKYVILGALSSAFLLYGLSIIYGLTGTMNLEIIASNIETTWAFWLACALITAGVGFKLSLVPFHMWAPDIYEGAPTPITAYLSVASKGAGLAFAFQLFYRMLGVNFVGETALILAILAAVTMTWGNCVAIVQSNIKRFMAYSAISQAGYLLMGFLGAAPEGIPAMIFYMLVYIVSNLAVFTGIIYYANATGKEQINDYQGLSRTNPLLALGIMIALFSLAGIPPLAGFVGKYFLFNVAAKAGFYWLVCLAAVNSTISLYYYLRVVRQMYIEPVAEGAKPLEASPMLGVTLAVTAIGAAVLGIIPYFYNTIHNQTVNWLSF